ncbi:MAG: hypothetical protein MJK18_05280, partial [Bdellovibrionales bacterium]|nr:hypothetical protein [Bdellovibrionales bacterium]
MAVGGHGKANFAAKATEFLFKHPEVQTLFCVGAAGAIDERVNVFDVVVATKTIEHDYKERFNPKAHLPEAKGDDRFLNFNQESFTSFKVHKGVIASGDEDIVSRQRADEIQEQTGALA